MTDIKKYIDLFLKGDGKNNKGRKSDERYASFDYCHNYFYSFYEEKKIRQLANDRNLQMSCLQLGFYLASWGMMRGSSFLLEKSVKNFKNLVDEISKMEPALWEIDVDKYDVNTINLILECKEKIKQALGIENKPSDTLLSKIMLGVFANIPAFDQYFKKSFQVNSFDENSLQKIKEFYENHKKEIDLCTIPTIDFLTAKETGRIYTKAKIIDMYGFMHGSEIINQVK